MNAAISFTDAAGAIGAIEEFEANGQGFLGFAGEVLAAAAGGLDLLGSCVVLDRAERIDNVVHVWVDTTACIPTGGGAAHTPPLLCPAGLGLGQEATVGLEIPQFFDPFRWEVDLATLRWDVKGPASLVPVESIILDRVTAAMTAATEAAASGEIATLAVEFEIFSLLELWEPFRVGGGLVAGECEVLVTGAGPADVGGRWLMTIDVTETSGVCVGEEKEDGEGEVEKITITQDGDSIEVTGFTSAVPWKGAIAGTAVTFGGDSSHDGGVTTSTFRLRLERDRLVGSEDWSWFHGPTGNSCPVGISVISATRAD